MRYPIVHPLPLSAAALMSLNDHVLKGSGLLPGWCTGKLSDVLGLFFFPMLLVTLYEACARRESEQARVLAGVVTALVFCWINLSHAPSLLLWPWMHLTPDATDLATLPMVWVSVVWMGRDITKAGRGRVFRFAAVAAAALSSMATSPSRVSYSLVRDYPIWRAEGLTSATLGACVDASWWVAKSGKQGVGVTLEFTNRCAHAQDVALRGAEFEVHGFETVAAARKPERVVLGPRGVSHVYVPFAFDNEQAWNDSYVKATLEVAVMVEGDEATLSHALRYSQRATYRCVPYREGALHDQASGCDRFKEDVSYVEEDGDDFMH